MLKNWIKAAAVAALFLGNIPAFAGDAAGAAKPSALRELSSGFVLDGFDALPAPEEIRVPEAAPAQSADEEKASNPGPAPEPGRDFTPKVQDQARVNAIMKLVSDIYNRKKLPYSQDGSTFKNKEGKLPQQAAGYYKEYTLLTGNAPHVVTIGGTTYQVAPDLSARGSERIIIGGGQYVYYTPDHYKNFILLTVVY